MMLTTQINPPEPRVWLEHKPETGNKTPSFYRRNPRFQALHPYLLKRSKLLWLAILLIALLVEFKFCCLIQEIFVLIAGDSVLLLFIIALISVSMFCFLYKTILRGRPNKIAAFQSHKLLYVLQNNPSILSLKSISTTANQHPFTVSYLIKTCGLSPESALLVSKYVHFETPDQPDSVITLLKNHGFSKTQITRLIRTFPGVLSSNVEKTLLPKLAFFNSKGVSSSDLSELLSKCPSIFRSSLEKQIIPSFNFLRNLLLSDEDTFNAIKLYPRIITYDCSAYILPNSNVLRKNGVPESSIVNVLRRRPKTLLCAPVQFEENVKKVKEIGCNPERCVFVLALYVLRSLSKSTWERKLDAFKKCGWSEEEFFEAFRNNPLIMATSEDKITAVMDFLVNEMGFQASLIAKNPRMLGLSLEKRIVPRALFVQDLLSKGLLQKKLGLRKWFLTSEKLFLHSFVLGYEGEASELLRLYAEKLNLAVGSKLNTDKL